MSGPVEVFTAHRGLMFGVAYRIPGSAADAEDVVQEAWLRWSKVDHGTVGEARGFLITTVSRLAIDRLRRLKAQRETYAGPWLPEPVGDDLLERTDNADLAFLTSIGAPGGPIDLTVTDINGAPAMLASTDGRPITVISFDIADDNRIAAVYLITNPEKLEYVSYISGI